MTSPDPFFLAPAQTLLVCLEVACEDSPLGNVPANFTLMAGEQVMVDLGPAVDYCCDGLGVVRFAQSYPMGNAPFPQPATGVEPCSATNYAMILEASIWRCYPAGSDNGNPPTIAQINAAAQQEFDDIATLYRTLCCFWNQQTKINPMKETVLGQQVVPVGPFGGCTGVAVQIITSVTGCVNC